MFFVVSCRLPVWWWLLWRNSCQLSFQFSSGSQDLQPLSNSFSLARIHLTESCAQSLRSLGSESSSWPAKCKIERVRQLSQTAGFLFKKIEKGLYKKLFKFSLLRNQIHSVRRCFADFISQSFFILKNFLISRTFFTQRLSAKFCLTFAYIWCFAERSGAKYGWRLLDKSRNQIYAVIWCMLFFLSRLSEITFL